MDRQVPWTDQSESRFPTLGLDIAGEQGLSVAEFQDLLYQIRRQPGASASQDTELPSGLQLGTGVRTAGTAKQFEQGSLEITENPLDMALDGRGFFEILLPDGTTAYTRNGQFQLTAKIPGDQPFKGVLGP